MNRFSFGFQTNSQTSFRSLAKLPLLQAALVSSFVLWASFTGSAQETPPTAPEQNTLEQNTLEQNTLAPAEINAPRLNEFVLNGTESCLEIKKGSAAIRPAIGAVTNPANYSNKIAPGGLAVIWGQRFVEPDETYQADATPLPRLLSRVQVLWRAADWDSTISGWDNYCGWRAAPLLFVSANQINFQVPMFFYKPFSEDDGNGYSRFSNFEGREYEFVVLAVLRDGVTKVSSNTFKLKINSHAPEFFPPAIYSYPDWQLPVTITPGETFVGYLTGLGKISDHEPEGTLPPAPPWTTRFLTYVEYRIGGARLLRTGYLFAGRAPGMVGVDQVNFLVPNLPLVDGQTFAIHLCTGADNADRCSERAYYFTYRAP